MKPVIALVGRPNVGKSTLFNRLTRSRDALVADLPGLTRDRHYGEGRVGERPFLVIDTGGFEPTAEIWRYVAANEIELVDVNGPWWRLRCDSQVYRDARVAAALIDAARVLDTLLMHVLMLPCRLPWRAVHPAVPT